jgi:polysaccharide biosynthesis/export protein
VSTRLSAVVVSLLLFLGAGTALGQEAQEQPRPESSTATQRSQKIQQLAATLAPRGSDYVLGSGDLLRIDVFDVPELSREVRVSTSGYISLPLIPSKIPAAGRTAFQLEKEIADLLEANQLVTHPQVSIFVEQHVSDSITIAGAVVKPMVYQAYRPTTLLEALAVAGGTTPDAGDYVLVTHDVVSSALASSKPQELAGRLTLKISLTELVDKADPKVDILLHGGDIVTVPRAGMVYVMGAVGNPGGYPVHGEQERMTALQAVALAHGLGRAAKAQDAVILRKDGSTGKTNEIRVNLKKILDHKAEDVQLYANDILFIPDSAGKLALWRAAEAGIGIGTGVAVLRGAR